MIRLPLHHSLAMTLLNSVSSLTDFCTYTPVFFWLCRRGLCMPSALLLPLSRLTTAKGVLTLYECDRRYDECC
jgi:hypothetical protein